MPIQIERSINNIFLTNKYQTFEPIKLKLPPMKVIQN